MQNNDPLYKTLQPVQDQTETGIDSFCDTLIRAKGLQRVMQNKG